jgi:hypothetical protein
MNDVNKFHQEWYIQRHDVIRHEMKEPSMKQIIIVAALLSCSNAFAFDIPEFCRRVSESVGGSYQIEEACRKEEREAQASLSRKQIPSRIEIYCREVAQAVGGSYQIMNACVEQELAAKARLR